MFTGHPFVLILILVLLLCFSAFFSGTETALMAISRLRLKHLAKSKPRRVKVVEQVLRKPERLITTILLGNNLVNVTMSAIATAFAISVWGERGIAYVTVLLTIVILIFAEITPKVFAKYHNEGVALHTGPIIRLLMTVLQPLVVAASFVSGKLLAMVGIDLSKTPRRLMTEEEIKTCIGIGWGDGTITSEENWMLARVFTLNDKTLSDIMVPKEKMIAVDHDATLKQIVKIAQRTGHSRLPVWGNERKDIIGFIHTKDLLGLPERMGTRLPKKVVRPPLFVPAQTKIDKQLRSFKRRRLHQAIVLDEGGQIAGLVTLEDILEELVGSIQDEYDG